MKQVECISNSLVQHSVKSKITKNSLCVNANNPIPLVHLEVIQQNWHFHRFPQIPY